MRSKYLVPAKAEWSWNTSGFSREEATVWSIIRDDFDEKSRTESNYDVFSGSFILQKNNEDPSINPTEDLWLLKGDNHNVKESFLVGRVEAKPLELIEKETNLVWEGKFYGDGCSNEKEKRFKFYYPGLKQSCGTYIYKTSQVKGYYSLGDMIFGSLQRTPPTGYLIKVHQEKIL